MKNINATRTTMTRREMLLALMTGAAVTACSGKRLQGRSPSTPPMELALCGAEEVFILSVSSGAEPSPRKVWSWRAAECPDIPETLRRAFRSTDDCKPVEGGRKILISSSSGAVALIERESRRALFYASVVNAHSVEMLPGGRLAAAASVSDSPTGNRLIIFDTATRRELASDRLVSAHGLVWDAQREVLWALGNDELRAYRLVEGGDDTLNLKVEFQVRLPDTNGHDLSPVGSSALLFISTGRHCWYFDRNMHQITPHDLLADAADLKSYSVHPVTGRVAYVQAEGEDWWAERVHFLKPQAELHLPGQRLYKARWV